MGVTGLLPALQVQAQKGVRYLKKLRGSAVGIDLAGWLHKFAAKEYRSVVLTKDHTLVVKAVLGTAHSYVNAGIKPVFVIDGRHLPGKGGTDAGRLEKRLKAQALVEAALDGVEMDDVIEAVQQGSELPVDIERKTLQAAVAVGDAVITDTMRELRAAGFHVTKAPYEADAQLACYDRLNVTQYTETVDSDLIVYGVRRVLTKVDHSSGTATLFDLSRWSEQTASNEHVPLLKLVRKWGSRVLLFFAVLAGCDYVHLPGFGPKIAEKILATVTGTGELTLEKVEAVARRLSQRKQLGGATVPADFHAQLADALAIYTAQIVHDPSSGTDVSLSCVGKPDGASIFGGWAPPPQCGVAATGTVTVTVGGVQVDMRVAQAHAQGFIETRGGGATLVELPAIEKVYHDGRDVPSHLTLDMVAGAELDPALVSEAAIRAGGRSAASVGKEQLKRFLLTRMHANLSGAPEKFVFFRCKLRVHHKVFVSESRVALIDGVHQTTGVGERAVVTLAPVVSAGVHARTTWRAGTQELVRGPVFVITPHRAPSHQI